MSENCYYHPDRQPVGICVNCGKALCYECAVHRDNKIFCNEDCRLNFLHPKPTKFRRRLEIVLSFLLLAIGLAVIIGLQDDGWIQRLVDGPPKPLYRVHKPERSSGLPREPGVLLLMGGLFAILVAWLVYANVKAWRDRIPNDIAKKKERLERNKVTKTSSDNQPTVEFTRLNKVKRIKCPYCSEMIADDAEKCRFCGEWLNEAKA